MEATECCSSKRRWGRRDVFSRRSTLHGSPVRLWCPSMGKGIRQEALNPYERWLSILSWEICESLGCKVYYGSRLSSWHPSFFQMRVWRASRLLSFSDNVIWHVAHFEGKWSSLSWARCLVRVFNKLQPFIMGNPKIWSAFCGYWIKRQCFTDPQSIIHAWMVSF